LIISHSHIFRCYLGLSGVAIPDWIVQIPNPYAIAIHIGHPYGCWLTGEYHLFELPEGAIRPEEKDKGNVYGCGLVLDPDNKGAIFFTANGKLLGKLLLDVLWSNRERTHVLYL
jgi:hypothetical protein